jgi:putative ABC transport system permease protein
VLRGRAFADSDAASSGRVIMINEMLARMYWQESDPLGERVVMDGQPWEIIGVVGDVKDRGLDIDVSPTVYVPMPQVPDTLTVAMNRWFLTSWLVRTSGPVDLSAALRAAVREADPDMPVAEIRPMTQVLSNSIAAQQFLVWLMGIFAALALLLTIVGVYGVLSYQVSQRTPEIGIRMALGARPGDVLKMVIREGMLLASIGIVIGLVAAFALTRLMSSLLFNVSRTDPITYAGVVVLLAAVALLTCYIPARRATKVYPMVALRYE